MVRNPPYNAEGAGSISGLGAEIPRAAEQLSPCATTTELSLRSLCATTQESVHHDGRAHTTLPRSLVLQLRPCELNKSINILKLVLKIRK